MIQGCLWLASAFWLVPAALAGGTASDPPPTPPAVDLATAPATASVRPIGLDGKPHPVHARLLTEREAVAAGDTVRVGLHLQQDRDWHTYWKSPGDIGQPTVVDWTLPAGVTAGPLQYPVPQRFEQDDQISYGYDGQVLLISHLSVPESLPPGTHALVAEAGWLVCKTSCIPGSVKLELPLEVVAKGTATEPSKVAPLFAHYTAQHPNDPLTVKGIGFDMALSASAVRPNEPFRAAFLIQPTDGHKLTVPKHAWPTFTPIVGGLDWWITGLKVEGTDEGGIRAIIEAETFEPDPLPKDDRIGGLIQVQVDGEWVRTEVTMALPWAAAGAEVKPTNSPVFGAAPGTGDGGGTEEAVVETAVMAASVAAVDLTAASLMANLFFAFIGGLILNVMPCVLPVITLKLYSLVEQTDITTREQRTAGLAYTGGILASFWALAATILVLRIVFDIRVDWGFQFQYPPYVAALATVVFVFGLSLFGVFEIPAFGTSAASDASAKEGVAGYFFTGVFATLLATPCSAPFLGTAIAYAFTAPTGVLVGIFTMVGVGLAFPFLVIAFVPAAYALLPRPGAWMEAFKQLLGFTLVATAVWLVSVLQAQVGPDRAVGFLAFLLVVSMGAWGFGRWGGLGATGRQQLIAAAGASALMVAGGAYFLDLELAEASTCDDGSVETQLAFDHEIPWQAFSEARVEALSGMPVFIDFTADWCLTCKVNEKAILETAPVREAMADKGYVPLKADWTRRDPAITDWLRRFGRAGVPFYLVLPADPEAEPIALPEVITQDLVIDALTEGAG